MAGFTFADVPDPCIQWPVNLQVETVDEVDYYKIGSADELYKFACMVNNAGEGVVINGMLTTNIVVNASVLGENNANVNTDGSFDVEAYTTAHNGVGPVSWTPIGTDVNPFIGTFDGNNNTVSGLYFNDEEIVNVGLFGWVGADGSVKNVGVVDSYFSAAAGVCCKRV